MCGICPQGFPYAQSTLKQRETFTGRLRRDDLLDGSQSCWQPNGQRPQRSHCKMETLHLPIRVFALVDDSSLQEALAGELDRTQTIPRYYQDGQTFLEAYDVSQPSCALIATTHEVDRGIRVLARLRKRFPDIPVIMVGTEWRLNEIVAAMKFGALEVLEATELSISVGPAIDEAIKIAVEARLRAQRIIPSNIRERLTNDEIRIFQLMLQGKTTKQVAADLQVSVRTIHYRKKDLLQKLDVANRAEAIELIRLSTNTLRSA